MLGRPHPDLTEPAGDPHDALGRVAAAPITPVEHVGDLAEARRDAVRRAVDEVTAAARGAEPVVALRYHQPHRVLALALGGRFDAEAVDRLRGRVGPLRRLALAELVVDCSQLQGCSTPLARSLAHLRTQMLIDGIRVVLHAPPDPLVAEIAPGRPEAYTVTDHHDADTISSPAGPGDDRRPRVG